MSKQVDNVIMVFSRIVPLLGVALLLLGLHEDRAPGVQVQLLEGLVLVAGREHAPREVGHDLVPGGGEALGLGVENHSLEQKKTKPP